jgi:hypothetical protein
MPRRCNKCFTVVLDCINGAGSVIAPSLLEKLGVRVIPLNCSSDGNFYRDPEPRPDNLADLEEAVRKSSAELGFATDPDATGSPGGESATRSARSTRWRGDRPVMSTPGTWSSICPPRRGWITWRRSTEFASIARRLAKRTWWTGC